MSAISTSRKAKSREVLFSSGQALRAAANGPFFPDWEFQTLFGLERSEVSAIAASWPEPTASPEKVSIAVSNSLNNLLGYPHQKDAVWSQWLSVDRYQLNALSNKLRASLRV